MPAPDSSQDDLLARLQAAQDAVRARDDFLAIAAHELRSPLNALGLRLAALERMAERSAAPELRLQLARARRSVDRYVQRAMMLLDVSRLHGGTMPLSPAPVRMAEIVAEVVEAYQDEAAFHQTLLCTEVETQATGWWDPHMVEQVVANLVSNAIKYGHGSSVRVRAALAGPDEACFEVADGGPGISAANRQKIFEKFERVVANAGDRAGFGLGLWIVGRMVAAHGGTIEVDTPPGGGSLFRVKLPLQPGRARGDDNQNKEDPTT